MLEQEGMAWQGSSSPGGDLGEIGLSTSLLPEQPAECQLQACPALFDTMLCSPKGSNHVPRSLSAAAGLGSGLAEMWSPLAFATSPLGMTDHSECTP